LFFFFILWGAILTIVIGIPIHANVLASHSEMHGISFVFSLILLIGSVSPVAGYSIGLYKRIQSSTSIVTENDIDAIYYLGFLITLFSLIVTVIVFFVALDKLSGKTVVVVAISFALSLTATAVALICRIVLIMLKEKAQRISVEAEFQLRIQDMVANLDDAYQKLGFVIARATKRFEEYSESIEATVDSTLKSSIQAAEAKVDSIVDHAVRSILHSDLVDSISKTADAISTHQQRILSATSGLDKASKKIASSFDRFGEIESDIQSVAAKMKDFNTALETSTSSISPQFFTGLTNSIRVLEANIQKLSNASDAASSVFSQAASQTSSAMESKGKELRAANDELASAFIEMAKALTSASEIVARGFR